MVAQHGKTGAFQRLLGDTNRFLDGPNRAAFTEAAEQRPSWEQLILAVRATGTQLMLVTRALGRDEERLPGLNVDMVEPGAHRTGRGSPTKKTFAEMAHHPHGQSHTH